MRCEIWRADISACSADLAALLDERERSRLDGFRRAADRERFTVGAALIRLVVGRRTGTPPAEVPVERRCRDCALPHGKPQVPGSGLHVSLSHSQRLVALAVTPDAPVGVDVEAIAPRDIDGLWRMVLAPGEAPSSDGDFFVYWCRKESAVKATGDGLRTALTRVHVSPPGEPARLLRYGDDTPPAVMRDLTLAPGYAGAVTVLADGPLDLAVHDLAELASPESSPDGSGGR